MVEYPSTLGVSRMYEEKPLFSIDSRKSCI
jgi:hypothetical protein